MCLTWRNVVGRIRPPVPYEVEAYATWHRRRLLEAKPGITGLWQVQGRSRVEFDDMVRLDLRYARNCSPLARSEDSVADAKSGSRWRRRLLISKFPMAFPLTAAPRSSLIQAKFSEEFHAYFRATFSTCDQDSCNRAVS